MQENDEMHLTKIKLDDIIDRGIELNRNDILLAEEIKYIRIPKTKDSYDEFGFLDKYKDDNTKKE